MNVFDFHERGTSGVDARVEDLAFAVIGAAIEVHRALCPGLPEQTSRNALSHELTLRGIPHECEAPVPIFFNGKLVGEGRIDILVLELLVLELKFVEALTKLHAAQAKGYLQAKKLQLALLINFNVLVLRDGIKRVVNTR